MASVTIYLRDHGNQVVSTGVPAQITSTDIEKQALVDAMQLWSVGENDGADKTDQLEARVGVGSTSPLAQSGVYAYAVLQDNITGSSYRERIPMPDLAKAIDIDGDVAWLTETDSSGKSTSVANPLHADYAAFKSAIEAVYVSPNGNTATLTRIYVPNKL